MKVFQLELYLKPRISDPAVITVNAGKDMKRIIAGACGIKKSKRQRRESTWELEENFTVSPNML